jgi:putative flavoprotein involved in K+ transport
MMTEQIKTVIVGGGQAGLATSYYLTQAGHEHVVLEAASAPGHAWRNDRWDSFTLLTPNWSVRLPGMEYSESDPDGFMPRDEVVAYFEDYIQRFALPIRYEARVTSVEKNGRGYQIITDSATYEANQVVIATGLYQKSKIPAYSAQLPPDILQIHSSQYRNPASLPPGAVLVVGSGQSGCQIAEELTASGRQVYLSAGRAGHFPRRYRGKDAYEWVNLIGYMDRTVDVLPSPKAKFSANPQLSGQNGGHSLNLHLLARMGVKLLGHVTSVEDGNIRLIPDLKESLAASDKFATDLAGAVNGYIQKTGIDAPEEAFPNIRDAYDVPDDLEKLDLKAAGINTVIWANGYGFDFSLVKLPVTDDDGYPLQRRGVTDYPGLYFVGLPWLHKPKSGLLLGVGEDAAYIAAQITEQKD